MITGSICKFGRILPSLLFRREIFHEFYKKGDEKYEQQDKKDDKSTIWHMKNGFTIMKKEILLWKEEVKEKMQGHPKIFAPGDTDFICKFGKKEDLNKWIVTSDKDNDDGFSECELLLNKFNHGLFQGVLDRRLPKDGRVIRTGYCNMTIRAPPKSFMRQSYFDWEPFTHLVFRIRGDGRSYTIILDISGPYDVTWFDTYNFVLYTRGGPYWQTAKIPFSKFMLSTKGRIQDKQGPFLKDHVKSLGITLADRSPGPFHLEIDYIGLYWDLNHTETFAYEMYHVPRLAMS